jgi:hypothetical protein
LKLADDVGGHKAYPRNDTGKAIEAIFRLGITPENAYFYSVKSKPKKSPKNETTLREQILQSMMASFKIEGINISKDSALATLKKVELSLGK